MNNMELKPCPFCGGEADYQNNKSDYWWIQCLECGCTTSKYATDLFFGGKYGKDWAKEAWNRRANQ